MKTLLATMLVVGLAGTWAMAADEATSAAPATSAVKAKAELPNIDTLIAQTEEKMKDVKDMTADVMMKVPLGGMVPLSGTMKAMSPGMVLQEGKTAKAPAGIEEPPLKAIKTIWKGDVMFQVIEATDAARSTIIKSDHAEIRKIKKEYADVPSLKLDAPWSPDYIHYLKNAKSQGGKLKVVSVKDNLATVECITPGDERRFVAVLDLKHGWLVKEDVYNHGNLSGTMELSNIRTNTGLKESDFAYTPPAGAKVFEAVRMIKGIAESARKYAEQKKADKKDENGKGQ